MKGLNACAGDDDYADMYRAACVKEFEIILEQAGKLLKKILKPYFASPKLVDALNFKDLFRHAAIFSHMLRRCALASAEHIQNMPLCWLKLAPCLCENLARMMNRILLTHV